MQNDAEIRLDWYAPEFDYNGAPVLDPTTGKSLSEEGVPLSLVKGYVDIDILYSLMIWYVMIFFAAIGAPVTVPWVATLVYEYYQNPGGSVSSDTISINLL